MLPDGPDQLARNVLFTVLLATSYSAEVGNGAQNASNIIFQLISLTCKLTYFHLACSLAILKNTRWTCLSQNTIRMSFGVDHLATLSAAATLGLASVAH